MDWKQAELRECPPPSFSLSRPFWYQALWLPLPLPPWGSPQFTPGSFKGSFVLLFFKKKKVFLLVQNIHVWFLRPWKQGRQRTEGSGQTRKNQKSKEANIASLWTIQQREEATGDPSHWGTLPLCQAIFWDFCRNILTGPSIIPCSILPLPCTQIIFISPSTLCQAWLAARESKRWSKPSPCWRGAQSLAAKTDIWKQMRPERWLGPHGSRSRGHSLWNHSARLSLQPGTY